MNDEKRCELALRWLVFIALPLVFMAQVYACRGMYGDGAHFMVRMLQWKKFIIFSDPQRFVSHFIMQTPPLIALSLGVHNLVFLRYFFSAWMLFCPLFVWGSTLWKLRADYLFWPFVSVFSFIYFLIDFYPVGEYGLCFALAAFCFAMLLRFPADYPGRVLLLVAAASLSFHYPSTLFHGSLLFLFVLAKPHDQWKGASKTYKYFLAFLFAASAASALWSILDPRDTVSFAASRDPYPVLQDVQFRSVLLFAVAASALFFVRHKWVRFGLVLLCALLLMAVIVDPLKRYVFTHCTLRAYVAAALTLCGIGLWWFDRRFQQQTEQQKRAFLLPATVTVMMFLTLAWFDVQLSLAYKKYLDLFGATVNAGTGFIALERTGYPFLAANEPFKWIWTYPTMSLLLRDKSNKAIILNPAWYHGFEPFDLKTSMPDLDAYYR